MLLDNLTQRRETAKEVIEYQIVMAANLRFTHYVSRFALHLFHVSYTINLRPLAWGLSLGHYYGV